MNKFLKIQKFENYFKLQVKMGRVLESQNLLFVVMSILISLLLLNVRQI